MWGGGGELPKKIYISKSNYKSGDSYTINESYFEEWYRQHGYEVIIPESLPVYKQISLAANAEAIATTMGTTSHFIIFARPDTRIDMISRTDHQVFLPQCLINQMKHADCYLADGSVNFLPCDRTRGVYLLGISDCWKDYVKQVWGEDLGDEETDVGLYKQYAEEWTRCFCDNPRHFNALNFQDLDCYDILERMARILLNRELDKSKYNVVSKRQLRKERDDAKKLLNEERERADKEIAWLKGVTEKLQAEMQASRLINSKNEERLKTALKKNEEQFKVVLKKSESEKIKLVGDYNALRNSLSFKVGRMITFIPRKVRNLFKKKKA